MRFRTIVPHPPSRSPTLANAPTRHRGDMAFWLLEPGVVYCSDAWVSTGSGAAVLTPRCETAFW